MQSFKEIIEKVEHSFCASLKGEETQKNLMWWGFISYLFFYFVIEKTIKAVDIKIVDILLSSLGVIYFSWHIYVMIKCAPKKPKLSKEEKKRLRAEAWRNAPKVFLRKLLLREPITKWNPVAMVIAVDLIFFAQFLGYII